MKKNDAAEKLKFINRTPPGFSEEQVRRIAAEIYGLEGEYKALVSERDQNFRITTADGTRYVFKIANREEDLGVVDLQVQALLHIERTDPTLKVPHIKQALDGQPYGWTESSDGTRHILRTVTWIEGDDLGEQEMTPALLRNVGGAVARLARALRSFHHPSARHSLPWDVTQIANLRPLTCHIKEKEERASVERSLDMLISDILPGLPRLRHQVIHNDANGENIVIDPVNRDEVAGIIDFGDMMYNVLAVDPAVTTADLTQHGDDNLMQICEVIAGYDAVNPLEEEEINIIYDLMLARYVVTLLITAWRKNQPDGPGYLAYYEEPTRRALESFLVLGRDRFRRKLRDICRFPVYCPKSGETDIKDDTAELLEKRQRYLGKTLELFYDNPVNVVQGKGTWLFTADGRQLLDAYNNVPQVGHAHPYVTRAVARQAAALNTHTRYLYRIILDYAERLTATMPKGLEACLFVNSGSEANDAAFRMAKLITGNQGAIVMENAYHGVTEAIDSLSPYDLKKRPSQPHVRTLVAPDPYRGPFRTGEADLAQKYAAFADQMISELQESGHGVAAFMIDPAFTSNGIPSVPTGYLKLIAEKVRAAGGLIIADEVQSGFGRIGTHMWGIESHEVVPDFITTGKPIGNGIPLGITVTRPEIREEFGKVTNFFSTFGGNPVACSAGLAVLDVIERERLMEHALETGEYKREKIRELMSQYRWVGDVRGAGLLTGIELVRDRATLEPGPEETERVTNHLRDNGVLVGLEGPHGNILKIRPPLAFGKEHADILACELAKALQALESEA